MQYSRNPFKLVGNALSISANSLQCSSKNAILGFRALAHTSSSDRLGMPGTTFYRICVHCICSHPKIQSKDGKESALICPLTWHLYMQCGNVNFHMPSVTESFPHPIDQIHCMYVADFRQIHNIYVCLPRFLQVSLQSLCGYIECLLRSATLSMCFSLSPSLMNTAIE